MKNSPRTYIEERNQKTLDLLEKHKKNLPDFCGRFFTGIAQTTSPLTRLNYAYDFGVFFEYLSKHNILRSDDIDNHDIKDINLETVNKLDTHNIEQYGEHLLRIGNEARAIARKYSALRSLFAYLYKNKLIKENIMPNVDLPKIHDKKIVRLEDDEAEAFVENTKHGDRLTVGESNFHPRDKIRNTTIVKTLLSTGMRVSELVGLDIGDVDMEKGTFRIIRKGGNEAVLYMTDELRTQYMEYFANPEGETDTKTPTAPGKKTASESSAKRPAPAFVNPQGERLGVRSVQNIVKKYSRDVVNNKNITPHKLRSTFGTNLYRATGDIYAVADYLGHQNVNTTKKHYAEITEDVKRDAIEKFQDKPKG